MTVAKHTFCRICEPFCPLLAHCNDHGDVVRLSPDLDHPCGGKACHKGLSFLEMHNDPDRVNYPLKRLNLRNAAEGEFAVVDWDAALAQIGGRIRDLRERFGPNAIAVYYGNPFAMSNPANVPNLGHFFAALGAHMVFSPNTQDVANKPAVAQRIYGSAGSLMIPDIENTDYFLCIGANPRVSRWSFMSVPNDDLAVLKRLRRRGGKIRFVNPRRTESSDDETGPTLLIKPGTDVYFLAALLLEIDRRGGFDAAKIAQYGKNVEGLRNFISQYPAETVARVTGITADQIKATARELLAAKSAAVYVSTGINQSRQGMLAYWLAEMINFLTGNLGRIGGTYRPTGLFDGIHHPADKYVDVQTSAGTFRLPDPIGHSVLPGALLATLIGNGDIKALIVLGGNPVLTVGGEDSFRAAALKLELMVSVDVYRSATGEMSDYLLPATDWLEHMDINLVHSGAQLVPYVQYTDAVTRPQAERRNAWWTMSAILRAAGLPSPLDASPDADDAYDLANGVLGLRDLDIEKMRTLPHQTAVLPPKPYDSLFADCLAHPDGLIDCYPQDFATSGLFNRCRDIFAELAQEPDDVLKIISLRTPYMQNSALNNIKKFRRGKQSTNPLYLTEADAAARKLHEGDMVRVFNANGSIEARVAIADDLRDGVAAMSHGYGNRRTFGMRTAQHKPGVNINALMPVGTGEFEPISYMSWITGVPVQVERVDQAQAERADTELYPVPQFTVAEQNAARSTKRWPMRN